MAQALGDMLPGSILYLKETGEDSAYYVYAHNYEQTRNGQGFTLLLRKNKSDKAYTPRSENGYHFGAPKNNVQLELDKLYETWFDEDTKAAIETTKYPVTISGNKNDVSTIESKLFVFSSTELNITEQSGLFANAPVGVNLQGPTQYVQPDTWIRDNPEGNFVVNFVLRSNIGVLYVTYLDEDYQSAYVQPILCIKGSHPVTEDGHLKFNDPPTAPGSIDASGIVSGGEATITLTAATDPDGTVESYIYERQVDGGEWTQFADVNALTQTDAIGEEWGTVAYRACAVDDKGVSGPYVTSETFTVNSGWTIISGPAEDMGSQPAPFDFDFSVSVSGVSSVDAITVSAALDGEQIYSGTPSAGEQVTIPIKTHLLGAGTHTIEVQASKDDYLPASKRYTFTVPAVTIPAGGVGALAQGPDGRAVYHTTLAQRCIGTGGVDIQAQIDALAARVKTLEG